MEQEVCLAGQLHRMDFSDDDVLDILKRCFSDRFDYQDQHQEITKNAPKSKADYKRILNISRVCGELSVSRALGDVDFKSLENDNMWQGPEFLPYPKNHNHSFQGDLISNIPEIQICKIRQNMAFNEFLILASDGFFDVIDSADAVRVSFDLLYRKKWTAKRVAARLAEIAIHLGSSDNTTVIVVKLYRNKNELIKQQMTRH